MSVLCINENDENNSIISHDYSSIVDNERFRDLTIGRFNHFRGSCVVAFGVFFFFSFFREFFIVLRSCKVPQTFARVYQNIWESNNDNGKSVSSSFPIATRTKTGNG